MLRFCSEGGQLIDYIFNIIITKVDSKYDVAFEQVYPQEKADQNFSNSFKIFVYPDNNAIESNLFFNFIIGDTAVDFKHGFIKYDNNVSGRCIISKYYYPTLFKHLLTAHKNDLANIAPNIAAQPNQHELVIDNAKFNLTVSDEKQKLLGLLFKTFTPFEISKIIINMLEARHIFPMSLNLGKLSRFVAALPLLIEPFRWNMNQIPVLPKQLKDATNIPVPTIIGISDPTILLEGRIDNHIIINLDTCCVVENPPFNVDAPRALDVLTLQLGFQNQINNELKIWSRMKAFPFKHIQKSLRFFISEYLMLFTGRCHNIIEFLNNISRCPEDLADSQVIHDLTQLESIPPNIKRNFYDFFDEIFNNKAPSVRLFQKTAQQPYKINSIVGSPSKPELHSNDLFSTDVSEGTTSSAIVPEPAHKSSSMSFNPFIDLPPPSQDPAPQADFFGFGQTTPSKGSNDIFPQQPSPPVNEALTQDIFGMSTTQQQNDRYSSSQSTPGRDDRYGGQQQGYNQGDIFGGQMANPFMQTTPSKDIFGAPDPFMPKSATPNKDYFVPNQQRPQQGQVSFTPTKEDQQVGFSLFDQPTSSSNLAKSSSSNTFDPFATYSSNQQNSSNLAKSSSSNAFNPFDSPATQKQKRQERAASNNNATFDIF